MIKEVLAKLKQKEFYGMWKKGQATWEEYRNVRVCRDVTGKAMVHLELSLAKDVKDKKKDFFKNIQQEKGKCGPAVNEMGALVKSGTKKVK